MSVLAHGRAHCSADVGAEPMKIGTGKETSIKEVAQYVQEAVGYEGAAQ
jgi:nucleoside-diphosphate-sugar epimerase